MWLDPDWRKSKKKELKQGSVETDRKALETTGIRSTRKRKKELQDSYRLLMDDHKNKRITLHPVDFGTSPTDEIESKETKTESEGSLMPETLPEPETEPKESPQIRISTRLPCYVCKKDLTLVHSFYDQMCPACGDLNFQKRSYSANLKGKVALITGARIKIGYEVGLKLLRAGALVIATSRFKNDTITRYSREEDFLEWKDRLHVYALDMRLLGEVEFFANHIKSTYPRLDIIINNAAQTIRRPPIFYKHLLEAEKSPLGDDTNMLSFSFHPPQSPLIQNTISEESVNTAIQIPHFSRISKASLSTAELSQIPLLPEDLNPDLSLFPKDEYDADGQQVDNRTKNSWILQLDNVSIVEAAEVHIVNALAPFVLNSKLKALMAKSGDNCFIINVSSMEGKFSRTKKANHPHTNMAKASMNMMTRTSAGDYAESGIFMNSVDTGWITYENPCELTVTKQALGLEPPIDEIDGAARILDPIFSAVNDPKVQPKWGLFYKDYLPGKW